MVRIVLLLIAGLLLAGCTVEAQGRPGSVIKWMDFGFDGPVGPGT